LWAPPPEGNHKGCPYGRTAGIWSRMTGSKGLLTDQDVAAVMEITAVNAAHEATYAAVEALAQRLIGHRLFTVLRHIGAAAEVERLYSSNPTAYPVGGRKQKRDTAWGRVVLDRGEVYIARNPDEVRAAFSDHALIASLGITSIMNVPIRFGGKSLGTMNLCGEAGQYTEADASVGKVIAALLVPVVMAENMEGQQQWRS
jgi:GAF domain-containing protein